MSRKKKRVEILTGLVVVDYDIDTYEVELLYDYAVTLSGYLVTVPKGFLTDFASVPKCLWSICPPRGKYTQAAVLHDYLYQTGAGRNYADEWFLIFMEELGVSWWRRRAMWAAVRVFGWRYYPGDRKKD